VLRVEGKARVRSWIQGITYHYSHSIPLTHSADQDNQPPVADIDGPRFARRGHPAAFDGTNSFDPDGKVVGWTWDFGDGQRADGANVEHTFLSQGVYTVHLTVVDQMGVRSGTTVELRVLPI
jgi:chitodextrinase